MGRLAWFAGAAFVVMACSSSGSALTPDAGADSSSNSGPAACAAAGGTCLLGGHTCANPGPQDCNPDRNPGGAFCCLP